MNVYVRELAAAMARQRLHVDVYTRADHPDLPAVVPVEPGFTVHHIAAGALGPVPKDQLPAVVDEFVEGVATRMYRDHPADALHANYWLSGVAGHALKHRFDIPLGCTFHTLARVKNEAGIVDIADAARAQAEAAVIGCSDAVLASCDEEADQLVRLYGAPAERVAIIPPGVDRAFFSPGARSGARRAIGVPRDVPMLLSVGRIQPLKGLDIAVATLAAMDRSCVLVVVGGPSGPDGGAYLADVRAQASRLGVLDRIRWVDPQPHELLSSYYRAADVVLVPSQSESFGLVALEAAACGTSVVATAVGGLRTLVVDGVTGHVVPRTPAAFATAARRILSEGRHELMGKEASVHADRFTWASAGGQMRALFADLADRVPVACR